MADSVVGIKVCEVYVKLFWGLCGFVLNTFCILRFCTERSPPGCMVLQTPEGCVVLYSIFYYFLVVTAFAVLHAE